MTEPKHGPHDDPHVDRGMEPAVSRGAGVALYVGDFDDLEGARAAYALLKDAADHDRLSIEGAIAFRKLDHGAIEVERATDNDTPRGMTWGIVGGIALGVLFPPALLGSTLLLGAGGAGIGRLRHLHNKTEMAAELGKGIDPGHSGLIALVTNPSETELAGVFAGANRVFSRAVDESAAHDIRSEAAQRQEHPGDPER